MLTYNLNAVFSINLNYYYKEHANVGIECLAMHGLHKGNKVPASLQKFGMTSRSRNTAEHSMGGGSNYIFVTTSI